MTSKLNKLNKFLKMATLFKIPLLAFCRPKVTVLNDNQARILIPLGWNTKNHLGSMYFGALAMGAELSVAVQVLERINTEKLKINFIFKDFNCQFLRRADTDVIFEFNDIPKINQLLDKAINTKERCEENFQGKAISLKSIENNELNLDKESIFMTYNITISLKAY